MPAICCSGATTLPLVEVDSYSEELRDEKGFIGDRATRRAFRAIIDDWRNRIEAIIEDDPLGRRPTDDLSKKRLDNVLHSGTPLAAGVLHTAIEEFANELCAVTLRFLRLKRWRGTQRIVVGGGLSGSRIGEVVIGRAAVLVKAAGHAVSMVPIRHHPDEAALIGAAQLAPPWIYRGSDAIIAVDIGGTNIRAGVVELGTDRAPDLSASAVRAFELWRYGDERPRPTREDAVARLVDMLTGLIKLASKSGHRLAPLIGVACPGVIEATGAIERGGQNLPGNWESARFNLAERLKAAIPRVDDHETNVIVHNDAVVQGLSEAPFMRDVKRWGVLTIGTGLGNAHFTNRMQVARDQGRARPRAETQRGGPWPPPGGPP